MRAQVGFHAFVHSWPLAARALIILDVLHVPLPTTLQTALMGECFRKALRLSPDGRRCYTTGDLINLLSVDACRVADTNIVPVSAHPPTVSIRHGLLDA